MKILILEDNEIVKDVLTFLLKDDFEIKIVEKDWESITELRQGKFDIFLVGSKIVLNLNEVVKLLSYIYTEKLNPNMKILVATNDKKVIIKQLLLGAGADMIVEKFPLRNVAEAVKNTAANISIAL